MHYLTLAGDAALGNFSLVEAKNLLHQALEKAQSATAPTIKAQAGRLHRRVAQCHILKGELAACRDELTLALTAWGVEKTMAAFDGSALGDHEPEFKRRYSWQRLLHGLAHLLHPSYLITGGGIPRSQLLESQMPVLPPRLKNGRVAPPPPLWLDHLEQAICYELLAQVSMQEHKREQAGYCAMRALRLGQTLPHMTPVVGRAYLSLCLVESSADKASLWTIRRYRAKARKICFSLGESGQLAQNHFATGVLDAGQARWADARENLHAAAKIAGDLKNAHQREEAICHLAHLEYYIGNFAASKMLYEDCARSAAERGDQQITLRCNAGIAAVMLATNEVAGAMAILALPTMKSHGQHALALLRSSRRQEALEMALRAKDRFKGKRTKYYVLKAYSSTAEVILKLLEDALARREVASQRKIAAASRMTVRPGNAAAVGIAGGGGLAAPASSAASDEEEEQAAAAAAAAAAGGGPTATTLSTRSESGLSSPRGSLRSEEGDDAINLDDPAALREIAGEWINRLDQFGNIYPVAKPRALLLLGQFQALSGGAKGAAQALGTFARSLRKARHYRMVYDEALALYELGKHTEAAHAQIKMRHLSAAQELFKECGAEYDVQRCSIQLNRAAAHRSTSVANGGSSTHRGGVARPTARRSRRRRRAARRCPRARTC